MGQPNEDYVSRLNEQNNTLNAINLSYSLASHYKTTAMWLQAYRIWTLWFQSPLMIGNVQNVISYKVKYEHLSHVVPV